MFASGKTAAVANAANYIEDVFSTYLYTGNSPSTQTITNGIDLAGKGGLVWVKSRVSGDGSTYNNILMDTARGTGSGNILYSNLTSAAQTAPNAGISSFNSNGFSLRYDDGYGTNYPSGGTFASWTFRKQPKFFDVVTYTGNDVIGRQIPHNLGSVPGCIIVKQTNAAREWAVYHTSLGNTQYINLNSIGGAQTQTYWNNTSPTSTNFTVGDWGAVNGGGNTYVAYLFAHNAGGFGLTGTDNVISCGSYTGNGSTTGPVVDLGYEPQWLLVKRSSASGDDWILVDNMRGFPVTGNTQYLNPNNSFSESSFALVSPLATGFQPRTTDGGYNANGSTYIYIAIRRGPMKVPTSGTSVFIPTSTATAASPGATATTNFPVDLSIYALRNLSITANPSFFDRLRGTTSTSSVRLVTSGTAAEASSASNGIGIQSNTTVTENWTGSTGYTNVLWNFRRAPNFFDEVCYTGTGGTQVITHNLGVTPEFIIAKRRNFTSGWYCTHIGLTNPDQYLIEIQSTAAQVNQGGNAIYNRTSTTFTLDTANINAGTYVAYLFATCAGVSKCTAFTGTGTLQTINCGFTAGSRFVLVKRTDAAGDWYVWDSSRGLSSSTDPYLLLNSTAAEVTSTNWVDTTSTGFQVTAASGNNVNINGASYIALAIA